MFKLLGIIIMALLFVLEIIAFGSCAKQHIKQAQINRAQKLERALNNY